MKSYKLLKLYLTGIFTVVFLGMLIISTYAVGPGLDNALEISTSALNAQKMRMNVIADNIANVDTTLTSEGGPYRRKTVVLRTREFLRGRGLASNVRNAGGVLGGVQAVAVVEDNETPLTTIYDPAHPQADVNGYVRYPNVNMTEELVDMTQASGAFESNVIVFNNTKQMMQTALEIGR